MAYRQIHMEIWDDPWFLDLNHKAKLLFVYLFSNSRTNMIGLYEQSRRQMAFETGLTAGDVDRLLAEFELGGKIATHETWIWVKNMLVRNCSNITSEPVQKGVKNAIAAVPDSCPLKGRLITHYNHTIAPQYGIPTISDDQDTIPIPSPTEQDSTVQTTEQKQEQQQQQGTADHIDADVGYGLLTDFGIEGDPADELADTPIPLIGAWITSAKRKGEKLDNPPGYVVNGLRSGKPPRMSPAERDDYTRFTQGDYEEFTLKGEP